MDNDLNVNALIRRMKETRIPEADVTGKVMQKVNSSHGKHRIHKKRQLRISPVWVAACALLFITAASVSAATFFKTTWNGIQVDISDSGEDTTIPTNKNVSSYKIELETALSDLADVWKTISVDEAAQQFPFPLLRPKDSQFVLVKSFGVVPKDVNYRVKSADELSLGGFYDIFQWNQQDIVVRQKLDGPMTKSLQDPNQTMSLTFQGASWENVEVTDDTLAMFKANVYVTANGSENMLTVRYKTTERKVISLGFRGNLSKEDLIKLAKTYVGK